ncbi:HD domain-containing protein [Maliponia aquimaris]|uniref:Guanosine-3',5'-bis(Diphosphate) 3'-pyrophosphohydrolase n=1 Tax=Maliponia aquimaris TaxID=1673631 RepID=A0A238KTP6_9RHOB|nr:HD domain-containing protein [Maliponia aquimaris]SMX46175.1 Guanosine-3',5'-bis(diphosphate) 3'-pyrophosphohydrolase [Maliponia aquimaris]
MPEPVFTALKPGPPRLEETAALAGHLHAGQVDKAGQPYIGHLVRVSRHLLRLFPDATPDERHAAWLHDAVEDTATTPEDLRALGYSETVIAIVRAVTKTDAAISYAERIDLMAREAPLGALRVKLADLSDNSDPARLATLPPERAASLGARYRAAIARLTEELAARG